MYNLLLLSQLFPENKQSADSMASSSKKSDAKFKLLGLFWGVSLLQALICLILTLLLLLLNLGKREPGDNIWTKQILKKHKEKSEEKETTDSLQQIKGEVELLEPKFDQKELASRKKTLYVGCLPRQTKISNIIDFFRDVGEVFRVRLMLTNKCDLAGWGFVEFASANQAKKALEKKKGEDFFLDHPIDLKMAKIATYHPQLKYCIDHKVWHKDYLRRQSLLIGGDESVDGLADFAEAVLFVANLSPQTKISHINKFFENVGEAVSIRLIVDSNGCHVGCGFVEFASADEAKEALVKKNGEYLHDHRIFLQVVKIASYPPQHKYNLAERLCYEDYIRRESLVIGEEGLDEPPNSVEAVALRKKTLFFPYLNGRIGISDVISFFKDVGEVVSVRLNVNYKSRRVGGCYVEFASVNEAKKALLRKNGETLLGVEVIFQMAEAAPYCPHACYIDHKVWYEDYLRQESLLIEEEDETVEPDFLEELDAERKTIFVGNLSPRTKIYHIKQIFSYVSHDVRVRLIVNDKNKHVGCCYVEFASAKEAHKALHEKYAWRAFHGHKLYMKMAKIAPYPQRPRYSHAEMLWYQDYVRVERITWEKIHKVPKVAVFSGKKITFSYDD